jgi:hypothetical protein
LDAEIELALRQHVFLISFDPLATNVVLVSLQKHNSPARVLTRSEDRNNSQVHSS